MYVIFGHHKLTFYALKKSTSKFYQEHRQKEALDVSSHEIDMKESITD